MGWQDNPKIRDLEPYAKKHGFMKVILVGIRNDGQFEVISYGRTAQLCKEAESANQQIYNRIMEGDVVC